MIAKIRHCAIWSDGCERSSRFYRTIFGMRQFTHGPREGELPNHGDDQPNRPRGQISDGVIGLALNPKPPGFRSGLDHFGFQLEDVEMVVSKVNQYYPDTIVTRGLEGVALWSCGTPRNFLPRKSRIFFLDDRSEATTDYLVAFGLRSKEPLSSKSRGSLKG